MYITLSTFKKHNIIDPNNFQTWPYEKVIELEHDVDYDDSILVESYDEYKKYSNPDPNKPNVYKYSYFEGNKADFDFFYCIDNSYLLYYIKHDLYFKIMAKNGCKVTLNKLFDTSYKKYFGFFKCDIELSIDHIYIISIEEKNNHQSHENYISYERQHDDYNLNATSAFYRYNRTLLARLMLYDVFKLRAYKLTEYKLVNEILQF